MHLTVFTQFSTDSWVWASKEDLARLELNSQFVIQMVTNWSTNVCRLCLKKMPLLYVEQMVRSKTGKILLERVLTSYPAVYWPPHHSHSLYKAGWPGPHKSVWTTPSSKKQTNKKPTETTQITGYVCSHKSGQMTTFLPARKAYIKIFKLNNNLGMGYFWASRS